MSIANQVTGCRSHDECVRHRCEQSPSDSAFPASIKRARIINRALPHFRRQPLIQHFIALSRTSFTRLPWAQAAGGTSRSKPSCITDAISVPSWRKTRPRLMPRAPPVQSLSIT